MTKILIAGAGVGGLTCAHELIKKGYEVHVFERNSYMDKVEAGGQARSRYNSKYINNKKVDVHSEYCWHVVAKNYYNLWRILKEIPINSQKTVADNLKPITQYVYGREDTDVPPLDEDNTFVISGNFIRYLIAMYKMGTLSKLSIWDIVNLTRLYLIYNTSCLERLEQYDSELWLDTTCNFSEEAKKWISDSPSIYLGMDIDKLSTYTMFKLLRPVKSNDVNHDFYAFNGPMNKQWFDIWRDYLTRQGVVFHVGNVEKLFIKNGIAKGLYVNGNLIEGDIVVNALSVESLAEITGIENYKILAETTRQIQTQVLYYLDKKVIFRAPSILVFPDTPWCLMIRCEGPIWDVDFGGKFKDAFSVGIGIWSRHGINGKTALECTRNELAIECWEQLKKSQNLFKYLKLEDGGDLNDVDILHADIWWSFVHNGKEITTYEPKYSNNINTLHIRPKIKDEYIKNLYHATAYCRTNADIFNMESACEAGVKAADEITNENNAYTERDEPMLINKILQKMDKILYDNGLPQVLSLINGAVALAGLYFIYR